MFVVSMILMYLNKSHDDFTCALTETLSEQPVIFKRSPRKFDQRDDS